MTKKPEHDPYFPRALSPPGTRTTVIDSSILNKAIEASRCSPRGRIIQPFHKSAKDFLHRMLNVLQPGSYIQPHRHGSPPKAESIVVLSGSICYITFLEEGQIDGTFFLKAGSQSVGVDTDAGVYHTFFALEADTVLFEVKLGPYTGDTDKQFAPWSPAEGSEESLRYLKHLEHLAHEMAR